MTTPGQPPIGFPASPRCRQSLGIWETTTVSSGGHGRVARYAQSRRSRRCTSTRPALGAWLIFGERVGRRGALTILLAVLGLTPLAFATDAKSGGTAPLWGYLCALASAAGPAAINLLTQA